jgi:hypothetical protein
MKYINRLYSEVLNEVRQSKSEEEKISLLRENETPVLLMIFKYGFGKLNSPYKNGVPKYTPDDSPYGFSYTSLNKEIQRLPFFFETKQLISDEKFRDKKLKNLLEMLHFSEAALVENIFSKKLDRYVSKEIVIKAFPKLKEEIGD